MSHRPRQGTQGHAGDQAVDVSAVDEVATGAGIAAVEMPSAEQLRIAATGFALLADPSRLRVLWVLAHGTSDVTTLARMTGVRPSAVSQHLAKLRLAGLVQATRDGRRQVYSVRGGHVRRLVLEALGQAEHQVAGLPDHD